MSLNLVVIIYLFDFFYNHPPNFIYIILSAVMNDLIYVLRIFSCLNLLANKTSIPVLVLKRLVYYININVAVFFKYFLKKWVFSFESEMIFTLSDLYRWGKTLITHIQSKLLNILMEMIMQPGVKKHKKLLTVHKWNNKYII